MHARAHYPSDAHAFAASAVAAAIGVSLALALAAPGFSDQFGMGYPLLPIFIPVRLATTVLGVGLVISGALLRHRSPGLAAGLLALACFIAGTYAMAGEYDNGNVAVQQATPIGWLVGYLVAFSLSGIILTLYAGAPQRRIGPWVAPLGIGVSLLSWPFTLVIYPEWWVSPMGPAALAVLAVLAAVRAQGQQRRADGSTARRATGPSPLDQRRNPVRDPRLIWACAAIAFLAAILVVVVGDSLPNPPFGGSYLPPMLWAVVGALIAKWTPLGAWIALAVSLLSSALRPLIAALNTVPVTDPNLFRGDPALVGISRPPFILASIILLGAIAAGWAALAVIAPGRRVRLAWVGTSVVVAVACAWWAITGEVGQILYLAAPYPAPIVVFGPILAGLVILGYRRLVPAFAEADAIAASGRSGLPYLTLLVSEFVTGQGQVRAWAAEAERTRLTSDLHAGVLPSLAQAVADSEAGAAPELITRRLREVEADVRGLLAERRLVVLEEFGLVQALEWLVERAQDRTGVEIILTVDARSADDRSPVLVERAGFRVAQLALDNAILHALPQRLVVDVLTRPDEVRIRIEDDGRGFDQGTARSAARTGHQGLADMHLAAEQVRARLDVVPVRAGGTIVTFAWSNPRPHS